MIFAMAGKKRDVDHTAWVLLVVVFLNVVLISIAAWLGGSNSPTRSRRKLRIGFILSSS